MSDVKVSITGTFFFNFIMENIYNKYKIVYRVDHTGFVSNTTFTAEPSPAGGPPAAAAIPAACLASLCG